MNGPQADRRPITILSADMIERIAAGEVIERPASVVRELVENALDARATHIRIELLMGGLATIRVADDGVGIPQDQLPLAITAHATNKVLDLADLDRIQTLGFRGEALASIAAVAELEVQSAADDSGIGHSLLHLPGRPTQNGTLGHTRGTAVTVRDLFHQMPSRRALLHTPGAERMLALDVLRGYALAHTEVRFTVIADGTLLLNTSGAGDDQDVVGATYGVDIAQSLIPLGPFAVAGGTLAGWIAPRVVSFANRRHVVLCVNGRPVRHRVLQSAMEAGYRPLLRKGRHPVLLLRLTLDPQLIDPNTHPAKAEVLVHGERAIAATIRETIHAALGQAPGTAPLPLEYDGHFSHALQYALPIRGRRRGMRIEEPYAPHLDSGFVPGTLAPLPRLSPLGQLGSALIVAQAADGTLFLIDQHRAHERLLYETLLTSRGPGTVPSSTTGNQERNGPRESGAEIAPAHAVPSDMSGQLLLEPLIIELTQRQAALLSARLHELSTLGLVCEPFGGSTFLMRTLPTLSGAATGLVASAHDLAVDAAEDCDDWLERFRIALACRAALRRGQELTLAEQRSLLGDLVAAKIPAVCPHGSPIMLRYAADQLARMFEW